MKTIHTQPMPTEIPEIHDYETGKDLYVYHKHSCAQLENYVHVENISLKGLPIQPDDNFCYYRPPSYTRYTNADTPGGGTVVHTDNVDICKTKCTKDADCVGFAMVVKGNPHCVLKTKFHQGAGGNTVWANDPETVQIKDISNVTVEKNHIDGINLYLKEHFA